MTDDTAKRAPVGTAVLLVLAALLHAAMLGCLAELPGADSIGQAIVLLYAAFLGTVLWLVLAALLLTAVARGRMPLWAMLAMVVLWPLSAVAVFMAGDAYSRDDPRRSGCGPCRRCSGSMPCGRACPRCTPPFAPARRAWCLPAPLPCSR